MCRVLFNLLFPELPPAPLQLAGQPTQSSNSNPPTPYIIFPSGLYEVLHRFANPRGGEGALTHEQYAFVVLITPGIAAQYSKKSKKIWPTL